MLNPRGCEHLFIGFDCAFRTLGYSILAYNPRELMPNARDVLRLVACGVCDILGENIDAVDASERARRFARAMDEIVPASIPVAHATVVIEHQPRKLARAHANAREACASVESFLVYHFSVVRPAARVFLIGASKKNVIARALLGEDVARTYAERKKQTRRAFVHLARFFNFDVCARANDVKHVSADLADSCIQILAAIFLCAHEI